MMKGSLSTPISGSVVPRARGGDWHRRVETIPEGRMLHPDVKELATHVQTAIRKWFCWIEVGAPREIAENVGRNAEVLARKSVIHAASSSTLS
jgi:hypothetical protein